MTTVDATLAKGQNFWILLTMNWLLVYNCVCPIFRITAYHTEFLHAHQTLQLSCRTHIGIKCRRVPVAVWAYFLTSIVVLVCAENAADSFSPDSVYLLLRCVGYPLR